MTRPFSQYRHGRGQRAPSVRPTAFVGVGKSTEAQQLEALRVRPDETDAEAWQRITGKGSAK